MEKNQMKDELNLVRLVSGEEVVALVTEHESTYTLKKGWVLIPGGEGKIAFMPFMPYTKAENGLSIPKDKVMFVVEPIEELGQQVKTQQSGLIVPEQQGIIT